MKLMICFFMLSSATAMADIKAGTYTGTDSIGSACELQVIKSYFTGQAHPLNERVDVMAAGKNWTVAHSPVIDASTSTAGFNHDHFQGIVATSTGAEALQIDMNHEIHGPSQVIHIIHNYRTDERSKVVCENLKLNP